MNKRLGGEITRAMTKARLTSPALAQRADVGESWIRQLRSGRIDRPAPDKLRRVARELGLDESAVLGMTDQLGAVMEKPGESTPLAGLSDLASAISALVEELRAARQERADLLERVEALEAAAKLRGRSAVGAAAARSAPVQSGE